VGCVLFAANYGVSISVGLTRDEQCVSQSRDPSESGIAASGITMRHAISQAVQQQYNVEIIMLWRAAVDTRFDQQRID
jgi:hypothetical protein